jgi:hypothetical protein
MLWWFLKWNWEGEIEGSMFKVFNAYSEWYDCREIWIGSCRLSMRDYDFVIKVLDIVWYMPLRM